MKLLFRMACIAISCTIWLTGCWDIKAVSDYNFVTALGIDYKDGKYVVYSELMDYGVVGKHAQGPEQKRPKVWVGKSEGDTVFEAMTGLYQSVQQYLYWDHIMAIVLSDSVMKQDIRVLTDGIERFSQIRFIAWVFGSREPIDKLFSQSTFYNVSPVSTLLHSPTAANNQETTIPPIRLMDIYSNQREPGQMNLIPEMSLANKAWVESDKPQPVLIFDGAYALYKGKAPSRFAMEQLAGVRWTASEMKNAYLRLKKGDQKLGMVSLSDLKKNIRVSIIDGRPSFSLDLSYNGIVEEVLHDTPLNEISNEAVRKVREDVLHTYRHGIERHSDLYGLEQALYRQNPAIWKRLTNAGQTPLTLTEQSLTDIDVHIRFLHAGALDLKLR